MSASAENKRGKVTPENQEEAARLLRIWNEKKADGSLTMTQAEFGLEFGIGKKAPQQSVANLLKGLSALSPESGAAFAKGLKVDVAEFSPRLRKYIDNLYADSTPEMARAPTSAALRLAIEFDARKIGEEAKSALLASLLSDIQNLPMLAGSKPAPAAEPNPSRDAARKTRRGTSHAD